MEAGKTKEGRWDLGGRDLEAVYREARRIKGESLWNDAWRRLRANRSAFFSLLFLGFVVLGALLVPLLPLPSPMALDLQDEPQPPDLSRVGNHGWQHRITVVLEFAEPLTTTEETRRVQGELAKVVSEAAGERAHPADLAPQGPYTGLQFVLPYRERLDPNAGSASLSATLEKLLPTHAELGATLAAVVPYDGYWDLNPIDSWLLSVRQSLWGFWQLESWLGTDAKGRDLLSRIVWGSRISFQVALVATLFSLLIGVSYGSFAGYVGGRLDNLMMRIVDVLYSVPFIFVVIFIITILNEYRTVLSEEYGIEYITVFYVVIGMIYWLTMARVVRGQVLSLKNSEFIEAARVLGASTFRILLRHIVPNILSIVIVYLTLTIPAVMLFEAFLSFLGLGVEPPKVSWGLLAVDSTEAVNPVRTFWWLVIWPAAAMGSTLLALNILGDGLRDALDPKLRGRS